MRARRRIAGLAVLSLLACVLAGSAASAVAPPDACCPESERSDARAPIHPCASLLPTPCCGGGLGGHTAPPLPLPPAALSTPSEVAAPACPTPAAAAPRASAALGASQLPLVLRL